MGETRYPKQRTISVQ